MKNHRFDFSIEISASIDMLNLWNTKKFEEKNTTNLGNLA